MSPRKLIEQSNVEVICTTDDIIDDLSWHKRIAEDKGLKTTVIPSFRTDNLLLVRRAGYSDYINKLSEVSGIKIDNLDTLKKAVSNRLDFFCKMGYRCADIPKSSLPPPFANMLLTTKATFGSCILIL